MTVSLAQQGIICWLVIGATAFSAMGAESRLQGAAPKSSSEADAWVRRALDAEAAGNGADRAAYLQRALAIDPDCPAAHWQLGEVRVGERWLPIDEAMALAARRGTVAQYRRRRGAAQASFASQVTMANWCASNQLSDEERLHLSFALMMKPGYAAAIDKLGLVRYQGRLMPRAQAGLLEERSKQSAAAMRQWKPKLTRLLYEIESHESKRHDAGERELVAIRDPLVIPALESLAWKAPAPVGRAIVKALGAMDQQEATDALLRQSVYSPQAQVRRAAAETLQSRSVFSYVPTLMDVLRPPVQVEFETYTINGQYGHRLALLDEGPNSKRSIVSLGASSIQGQVVLRPRYHFMAGWMVQLPDTTLERDAAVARQVVEANTERQETNDQIVETLRAATGQDLPAQPQDWWNWWFDYNEMYQPPIKPTSQVVTNSAVPTDFRYYKVSSCFVAGTPVWTSTGPLPIEQIGVGDCLLSQDAETGELAFKPVVATTQRPPSPLLEIRAGRATLRVTRGHPFWVCGVGWQMAKELQVGQSLHTTHGPLAIDAIADAPEETCYNLVVMDFSSYFVTDEQLLVHDNTLRHVTTATVPGRTAR